MLVFGAELRAVGRGRASAGCLTCVAARCGRRRLARKFPGSGGRLPGAAGTRRNRCGRRRHRPGTGRGGRPDRRGLTVDDVAVLIPAHNEAAVIAESLAAITELVPRKNVHVVSDGSTDDTVAIAWAAGVKVDQTERTWARRVPCRTPLPGSGSSSGSRWSCCWTRTRGSSPATSRPRCRCSIDPGWSRWRAVSGRRRTVRCRSPGSCWWATASGSTRSASGC